MKNSIVFINRLLLRVNERTNTKSFVISLFICICYNTRVYRLIGNKTHDNSYLYQFFEDLAGVLRPFLRKGVH